MTRHAASVAAALGFVVFLAADALAQPAPETGQMAQSGSALFRTYCAVCQHALVGGDTWRTPLHVCRTQTVWCTPYIGCCSDALAASFERRSRSRPSSKLHTGRDS